MTKMLVGLQTEVGGRLAHRPVTRSMVRCYFGSLQGTTKKKVLAPKSSNHAAGLCRLAHDSRAEGVATLFWPESLTLRRESQRVRHRPN